MIVVFSVVLYVYTYSPQLGQRIAILYSFASNAYMVQWYWHNYHLEQYNISDKIHINPARYQPYPKPKYISFNSGFRGDNSGTCNRPACHYSDVIMIAMTSQITGVPIVYSTVCSGTNQRKHQSSASLAFVMRIHRWLVNSSHKGPVKRKMLPFDEVVMDLASFA